MSDYNDHRKLTYEELEHQNKDLREINKNLRQQLDEIKKYYQSFDKFVSTVYDPNKATYKELEDKLKNFEIDKNREIDELWATKIKPLREKLQQLEGQFISEEAKRKKDIDELWETRITPLQNQVKDRELKMESMYTQQVSYTEEVSHLKKIIDRLNTIVNYAVGYISACEQFRDKHPNDVKNWLFEGLKKNQ